MRWIDAPELVECIHLPCHVLSPAVGRLSQQPPHTIVMEPFRTYSKQTINNRPINTSRGLKQYTLS